MLAELKSKSQVTIPKKVVSELGLETGDMFEVVVSDGSIKLIPVVVWPKAAAEELERQAALARGTLKGSAAQIFDSADELIADLHKGA